MEDPELSLKAVELGAGMTVGYFSGPRDADPDYGFVSEQYPEHFEEVDRDAGWLEDLYWDNRSTVEREGGNLLEAGLAGSLNGALHEYVVGYDSFLSSAATLAAGYYIGVKLRKNREETDLEDVREYLEDV